MRKVGATWRESGVGKRRTAHTHTHIAVKKQRAVKKPCTTNSGEWWTQAVYMLLLFDTTWARRLRPKGLEESILKRCMRSWVYGARRTYIYTHTRTHTTSQQTRNPIEHNEPYGFNGRSFFSIWFLQWLFRSESKQTETVSHSKSAFTRNISFHQMWMCLSVRACVRVHLWIVLVVRLCVPLCVYKFFSSLG